MQGGVEIVKEVKPEKFSAATVHCDGCVVRNKAICSVLTSRELDDLAAITRHVTYEPGQIIVAEAEAREIAGTITSGVVKLTKAMADGREQIVGLLFASDFIGRIRAGESRVYAEAVTRVEACIFNTARFRELTERYPELRIGLYERALNEIDAAREWMVLLGRKSAEEKIATFFVMLAERDRTAGCQERSEAGSITFKLPMSRADMADYLGLTIETVSRQVTRFKTGGLIRMLSGRDVLVPDLARLKAIANGEFDVSC